MNKNLLSVLRTQAERLLMRMPGTLTDTPIYALRKQMEDMYDFDCRNPMAGERAKRLTSMMRNWLSACEYAMWADESDPDPSELGILHIISVNGVMTIETYCADYEHFKEIPIVITYQGKRFGKTGWNSDKKRCFHKSNAPVAMGVC